MIRIQNIRKVYQRGDSEVHALRGVTCEVAENSFNFVVGPSGSGKSSLLYLIGALDQPTSGDVQIHDRSLSQFSNKQRDEFRRNQIGFVFQSFNLLRNLTALDNVLVPYMPVGISSELRRRAQELLDRVGLKDRMTHRPNHLSGGEQQRVAIARALLKQPQMVLADEPTGELDSATGAEVFGYLRDLHAEQSTTVIVVTHDERYIRDTDRVIALRDGKLAV